MSNKNSYYDRKNKSKYNYKSHTTYVKDPPIEDSITKVVKTSTFNTGYFLKSIGVFIIILFMSSFALNGYLDSRIVSAQTEETIAYTYQKQIGTELVGGNFDFINTLDDFKVLMGKKIYINYDTKSITYNTAFKYYALRINSTGSNPIIKFYNFNDELIRSINSSFIRIFYTLNGDYTVFNDSIPIWSNYINNQTNYFAELQYYNQISYFIINDSSDYYFSLYDSSVLIKDVVSLFNEIFIYDDIIEKPIYQTITYTYNVKDVNYDWDKKIKQLSTFKPLFKKEEFEENKTLIFNTLTTYTLYGEVYNSSVADYNKQLILDYYKDDEFIKFLLDNEFILIKYINKGGVNFLNKYPQYYSYIDMDNFVQQYDNILLMFPQYEDEIIGRIDYINENYVTNFNVEDYRAYMERDLTLKDIFLAPITFVHNVFYNFGVLIGLITIW